VQKELNMNKNVFKIVTQISAESEVWEKKFVQQEDCWTMETPTEVS
jgi:hypothetical protein